MIKSYMEHACKIYAFMSPFSVPFVYYLQKLHHWCQNHFYLLFEFDILWGVKDSFFELQQILLGELFFTEGNWGYYSFPDIKIIILSGFSVRNIFKILTMVYIPFLIQRALFPFHVVSQLTHFDHSSWMHQCEFYIGSYNILI